MFDRSPKPKVPSPAAARAPGRGRSLPAAAEPARAPAAVPFDLGQISFAPREGRAGPRPNHVGLPDRLKAGVEALSGVAMDEVRVRYRSPEPARLGALAFARGRDIHLGPGQERHLPHEAWHVVQQAEGRVKPTARTGDGVTINADPALEREAEFSGRGAMRSPSRPVEARPSVVPFTSMSATVQMVPSWTEMLKRHSLALGGAALGAAAGAALAPVALGAFGAAALGGAAIGALGVGADWYRNRGAGPRAEPRDQQDQHEVGADTVERQDEKQEDTGDVPAQEPSTIEDEQDGRRDDEQASVGSSSSGKGEVEQSAPAGHETRHYQHVFGANEAGRNDARGRRSKVYGVAYDRDDPGKIVLPYKRKEERFLGGLPALFGGNKDLKEHSRDLEDTGTALKRELNEESSNHFDPGDIDENPIGGKAIEHFGTTYAFHRMTVQRAADESRPARESGARAEHYNEMKGYFTASRKDFDDLRTEHDAPETPDKANVIDRAKDRLLTHFAARTGTDIDEDGIKGNIPEWKSSLSTNIMVNELLKSHDGDIDRNIPKGDEGRAEDRQMGGGASSLRNRNIGRPSSSQNSSDSNSRSWRSGGYSGMEESQAARSEESSSRSSNRDTGRWSRQQNRQASDDTPWRRGGDRGNTDTRDPRSTHREHRSEEDDSKRPQGGNPWRRGGGRK